MTDQAFDALINDVVDCRAAHKLQHHSRGMIHPRVSTSCSCGWETDITENLRPQWTAIDKHLIDDVLPPLEAGVCRCGRAMLLGPLGKWFHAQRTLGHRATAESS